MKMSITNYIQNLQEKKTQLVKIADKEILLVMLGSNIFAIDKYCTHEKESLEDGWIDDCCIECPKHGAKFDIKTGEPKTLPAVKPLKKYDIVEENGNYIIII